jgi:catechol-2,3-dioxygenase
MKFKTSLDTIILYVQNVENLKIFYTQLFNFPVVEEYESLWALLDAGSAKIGLHKIGEQYLNKVKGNFKFDSNLKIVFEIDEDINHVRAGLLEQNVPMREIKTFDNYEFWLCDGEDPEGNVFQLKQRK